MFNYIFFIRNILGMLSIFYFTHFLHHSFEKRCTYEYVKFLFIYNMIFSCKFLVFYFCDLYFCIVRVNYTEKVEWLLLFLCPSRYCVLRFSTQNLRETYFFINWIASSYQSLLAIKHFDKITKIVPESRDVYTNR